MLYLHFSLKVHRSEELYRLRIENESIPFKFSPRYNKTIRHLDTLGIQVIIIILQTYIIEVKYLRYTSNPNYYDIREWQPFKNLLYSGYECFLFAFQGKMAQPITMKPLFSVLYNYITSDSTPGQIWFYEQNWTLSNHYSQSNAGNTY